MDFGDSARFFFNSVWNRLSDLYHIIKQAQRTVLQFFTMNQLLQGENPENIVCDGRCGHITFCDGHKMYVWGGYTQICVDGSQSIVSYPSPEKLWIYHTAHDAWMTVKCCGQKLPTGITGACCATIYPNLYVLCGHAPTGHTSMVRILNLETFSWSVIDTPEISGRDKFAAWAYDDKIFCFGGFGPNPAYYGMNSNGQFVDDDGPFGWNNQLLVFDPLNASWTNAMCKEGGNVPLPRAAHACTLIGDSVYLFGGRHRSQRMQDLHCLDMKTLRWSGEIAVLGPIPAGRSWHTLTHVKDDTLFLYGGFSTESVPLDDVWTLNVGTLSWTELYTHTGLPRLWHTAVCTKSEEIFIFGGCRANVNLRISEEDFPKSVLKFAFKPPTLVDLCLNKVYESYSPDQWTSLPHSLQNILTSRFMLKSKRRDAVDDG